MTSLLYDLVVLFLLLTEVPVPDWKSPEWLASVKRVAIAIDIASERENWVPRFANEVNYCRYRLRECWDLPLLREGWWLPPHDVAYANAQAGMSLLDTIRWWATVDAHFRPGQPSPWAEIEKEQARLMSVWCQVSDATCESFYPVYRRETLARLKELLGEDWNHMRLPPPMAVHVLPRVD